MLKQFLSIILLAQFISFSAFSQTEETVLISFEDEIVSAEEFTRIYEKNNSGEMIQKSTVDEYLELFINFKLKVKEAEALGYDTISDFVNELDGYRRQLAQPYLSADGLIETLKKEAYERLKEEIKASHILIASKETDSPEDTLKAFKRAEEVRKKLLKGEGFDRMALQYSDDPSAKTNKGNLGYFSAFYMVYPFESAAYNTKVGGISEITKTRFGYHVIKVEDRRPWSGELTVAHILISSDPEVSKIENPESKINEIYEKLQEGESFDLLARQFSDDTRSASNGGVLPVFGIGKMVKEFEEVSFALENDGDYSKPFKTDYGWHIVKRVKKDGLGTYEEIEAVLTEKVKKDSRSKLTQVVLLKKIKEQYGFEEYPKAREAFFEVLDSSYFSNAWSKDKASKLKSTLFMIGDWKVSQLDFATYIEETQRGSRPMDLEALVNGRYKQFLEIKLLEYKNLQLEEEFPEFKALMREYHDGILLFNLTNEVVWTKAVKDTLGLEKFYNSNKENYRWGDRVDATVYSVKDKDIASQVRKMISMGIEEDSILEVVNRPSQLNIKIDSKKFEKGDNEFVDDVKWQMGVYDSKTVNDRLTIVHVKEVLKAEYKTLEDSRGIITSDYQSFLENQWIVDLKKKYPYSVDTSNLEMIKKELK